MHWSLIININHYYLNSQLQQIRQIYYLTITLEVSKTQKIILLYSRDDAGTGRRIENAYQVANNNDNKNNKNIYKCFVLLKSICSVHYYYICM